jgi:hypothetical protein
MAPNPEGWCRLPAWWPSEAAALTLRQLQRRCGTLSSAQQSRIQGLPLDDLEALADALLDFDGPEDLNAWLSRHAT